MFVIARHPGTKFEQHLLPARRRWVEPGEGWNYSSLKMVQRAYKKMLDRYPAYAEYTSIKEIA